VTSHQTKTVAGKILRLAYKHTFGILGNTEHKFDKKHLSVIFLTELQPICESEIKLKK